jgi:hypothetical protein
MLVINSGSDVANETIVIPTIILGIFNLLEADTAERSKNSPARITVTSPIVK